jgi:hypothetical protein
VFGGNLHGPASDNRTVTVGFARKKWTGMHRRVGLGARERCTASLLDVRRRLAVERAPRRDAASGAIAINQRVKVTLATHDDQRKLGSALFSGEEYRTSLGRPAC